jgi:hypothetical protein
MALSSLESEHRKLFQSEIELVTPQFLTFDNLPDDLLRLARMPLDTPDVLSSLIKVYDPHIKNLVLVGQSLSMKLCLIVFPKIWFGPNHRLSWRNQSNIVLIRPLITGLPLPMKQQWRSGGLFNSMA